MVEKKPMSRYSHPCPACGAVIHPSQIPQGDSFPCPSCGVWLKYDSNYTLPICGVSLLTATILTWRMGYRGAAFILVTTCATLLLCILGAFFEGMTRAPGFKEVQGKPFDGAASMHFTDRHDADTTIT